ncbi:unnamed protein product [Calypogeia fissa]
MKEKFLMRDSERMTQGTFLDWVSKRGKGLEPEEHLLEFKKKFNQLPSSDFSFLELQKASLFLQSTDSNLRDELGYALDLINPQRRVAVDWFQIEEAVEVVSNKRRVRALDEEAISSIPSKIETKDKSKVEGKKSDDDKILVPNNEIATMIESIVKKMKKVLNTRVLTRRGQVRKL